jgi:hypothetical protein
MRVASSDWCASRIVVSVTSTRFSFRIQRAKASGPSRIEALLGAEGERRRTRARHDEAAGAAAAGRACRDGR